MEGLRHLAGVLFHDLCSYFDFLFSHSLVIICWDPITRMRDNERHHIQYRFTELFSSWCGSDYYQFKASIGVADPTFCLHMKS